MKVALSLEYFDPARGGLEQWTWQFARALAGRGHDVHVVASDFAEGSLGEGITAHRLGGTASRFARAAALEEKLRALHADITHDMGSGWFADVFHPHGGSTIACHEHNLLRIPSWRRIRFWREKRYREQREIERRQHATGALILCVSEMVRRHFTELHGLAAERLRVIHNGVDTTRFAPSASLRERNRTELRLDGETLFLLVAHNLKLKNAELFLRALSLLQTEKVLGWIVGSTRRESFERLALKLGIASIVQFSSLTADIRSCYAAADVCVQPTWYDPCSLVSLEALAMGLPLLTSRFNGISELMTAGCEGEVLSDPADAAALAGIMRKYLSGDARSAAGARARSLALKHSFDAQVDAILALYDELLAKKRRLNS